MTKAWAFISIFILVVTFFFGCGSDSGQTELAHFYREKTAAVNQAADALAAAQDTGQAARELDRGFKILREAVAQEGFIYNKYPRADETPEIHQLQQDYLTASEKFSREVEALPKRLKVDRTLIEALKNVRAGNPNKAPPSRVAE